MSWFIKKSSSIRIIEVKTGQLVLTFDKSGPVWLIHIFDEKLSNYIFKKLPEIDLKGEYDDIHILDFIYVIKTKFRKFEIDCGVVY